MTYDELNGMTVLQLRKLAREHAVVLGSGIDKAGIIEKLLAVLSAFAQDDSPYKVCRTRQKFAQVLHFSFGIGDARLDKSDGRVAL